MKKFDIPVCLIFFKRKESTLKIINRISEVKPSKLYLISDGPRNEDERSMVMECRDAVLKNIDWDCEIIKDFAEENKGVCDRIGLGAKRVLSQEEHAIFLEDDNLPEVSFFYYCEELLTKYKNDTRILWICGTNYLGEYLPEDNSSYMFTQHLLPCGWATWAKKYNEFYDENLSALNKKTAKMIKSAYYNKALYRQQKRLYFRTQYLMKYHHKKSSWDYQMAFALRYNNLYGISPSVNQIKNIGVDEFSIHGGNSFKNVMVRRFCGMESKLMNAPLKHPDSVYIDNEYEKTIGNIILLPFYNRLQNSIASIVKPIIRMNANESLKEWLNSKFRRGCK